LYLKFESLAFKNILSYGSVLTKINFSAGLNLLTGKNGQGKSTLLDALSFCLFGRPYRKIRINELINRRNKRALYTECTFVIGGDNYKIIRSIRPNKLLIVKNGVDQEGLSTRDLTQEEIDKIIGIDYYMFRQVISLALNYNRAFLTLSSVEKRSIIESVFNVRIVGDMLKVLKKRSTAVRMDNEIKTKTLTFLENDIKSTRRRVREIAAAVQNFEQDREKEMHKANAALLKNQEEITKAQETIELANQRLTKIGSVDCKRHRDLVALFKQRIEIDRSLLREKDKQEAILNNNVTCPICHRNMTAAHRTRELEQIALYRTKLNGRIAREEKRIEKVQREIERLQHLQTAVAKLQQICARENSHLEWLREAQPVLTLAVESVQNRKTEYVDIAAMEEELDGKAAEYKTIFTECKLLSKQLHTYDIVSNILSDNGIKAYFFKKLLPILNQKVNENLARFEIPLQLQFNELMEEHLLSTETMKDVAYFGCSEGEKKRVDVCVLLAFIDVVKLVCNWNCNLLIFDELFDVHVDDEGLETIMKSLIDMTKANKSVCIYIISHKLHDSTDMFDAVLSVQKQGSFSKLSVPTTPEEIEE
jgi:DNA repair exonuclease SbcCD ATPase subunit